eukprot:XP_025982652.1 uncharacterized protein LOC113000190 [Glycine max]
MAFRKNHPPKFSEDYDPEGARLWLAEIEKIFEAMGCLEEHKVPYVTFMLQGEAENWWKFVKPSFAAPGDCKEKMLVFGENVVPKEPLKENAANDGVGDVRTYMVLFSMNVEEVTEFLGHVISKDGVAVDPIKVESVVIP